MTAQPIGLVGAHQRWNAALASRVLTLLSSRPPFDRIAPEHISLGLAKVHWPGRFQQVEERFILDGAHNSDSAEALVTTWRERFPNEQATIIFGAMRDKDVAAVCSTLAPIARRFLAVAVNNPRSCTAADLAAIIHRQAPDVECKACENLQSAVHRAKSESDGILLCGSLFLVGEALFALGLAEAPPESSSQ
jgi:dihydrofolate synthase/folylpolyglutamate synthase